jgi:hypothetical protein
MKPTNRVAIIAKSIYYSPNSIMDQFRLLLACLLVSFIAGCKSSREPDNTRIGRGRTFASFSLTSSTGATFSLTAGEMRELEKVWSVPIASGAVNTINTLITSSPKLTYSFVLDNGYTETSDAYLGTVSGIDYLGVTLQGDGGGFMADVYTMPVPLTSIFSESRRSNLSVTLGALAALPGPSREEGEQGSGQ